MSSYLNMLRSANTVPGIELSSLLQRSMKLCALARHTVRATPTLSRHTLCARPGSCSDVRLCVRVFAGLLCCFYRLGKYSNEVICKVLGKCSCSHTCCPCEHWNTIYSPQTDKHVYTHHAQHTTTIDRSLGKYRGTYVMCECASPLWVCVFNFNTLIDCHKHSSEVNRLKKWSRICW